jgi:hypothetical protein
MMWMPAVSEEVAALVALPLTSVTAKPKFAPSIWNCTLPVGVETGPLTLAVKVMDCPTTDGFVARETEVKVAESNPLT